MDQTYPKRVFLVNNGRSEHHHWILHVPVSLGTKFQLKLTILICLDQIWSKREFPVWNRESEHHHWILHIRISLELEARFQLKLTILNFCSKFVQCCEPIYLVYTKHNSTNIVTENPKTLKILLFYRFYTKAWPNTEDFEWIRKNIRQGKRQFQYVLLK